MKFKKVNKFVVCLFIIASILLSNIPTCIAVNDIVKDDTEIPYYDHNRTLDFNTEYSCSYAGGLKYFNFYTPCDGEYLIEAISPVGNNLNGNLYEGNSKKVLSLNKSRIRDFKAKVTLKSYTSYTIRVRNYNGSKKFKFNIKITPPKNASNSSDADKLIDELCRKVNTHDSTVNESDIINKLSSIGVKLAKDDPMLSGSGDNKGLPKFNPYPSNVYIFVFNDSVKVNNVIYPLKVFWVIPKSGSNLVKHYKAFNVYKEPIDNFALVKDIIKIYRDKAIGALISDNPIVAWSPYELLLGGNKKNYTSVDQYEITVDLQSFMKYVYYYSPQAKSWQHKLTSQIVFGKDLHYARFITKDGLLDYAKGPIVKWYAIKGTFYTNYKTIVSKLIPCGTYSDRIKDLYYYDVSNKSQKLVHTVTPPYAELVDLIISTD